EAAIADKPAAGWAGQEHALQGTRAEIGGLRRPHLIAGYHAQPATQAGERPAFGVAKIARHPARASALGHRRPCSSAVLRTENAGRIKWRGVAERPALPCVEEANVLEARQRQLR